MTDNHRMTNNNKNNIIEIILTTRITMKTIIIYLLKMIKKMNINVNEYEGMEVNDVDGRVICSVELTSVEGYTVYCLHVYGYEVKDDKV